jgi:DNA-binding FadR family transcriptional regulator
MMDDRPTRTIPTPKIGDDLLAVLRRISGTSPLDIMNVRKIVEPQAAEAAATRASEAALAAIREAHEAAGRAAEMDDFERWDAEFHKRIFVSTRNELLTNLDDMVRVVRAQPPWTELKRRSFNTERRLLYCREHEALLRALERRDARGAADAMRTHLESVAKTLFGARY